MTTLCWVTDCSAFGGSGAGFLASSPAGLSAARPAPAPNSAAAVIRHTSILFTDVLLGWLRHGEAVGAAAPVACRTDTQRGGHGLHCSERPAGDPGAWE